MDKLYYEHLNSPLIKENLSRLDEKQAIVIFSKILAPYVQVFEKSSNSNIFEQVVSVCKEQFPCANTIVFYNFICFLLVTKCKVGKSVGLESNINLFAKDKKALSIRSNSKGHSDDKPTLNFTVTFTNFFPEIAMLNFDYQISLREEVFSLNSDEFTVEIDSLQSLMSHTQFFGKELKEQINEMLMN